MIGNATEAQFIHNWYHNKPLTPFDAPEGWRRLGSGSFRVGFLSPSGVVYKVQQDLSNSRYQTNEGEWKNYKRLYLTCKMPRHSRLPQMGFFPIEGTNVGVIAIEKLSNGPGWYGTVKLDDGSTYNWGDVVGNIQAATRVGDLYGDNVLMDAENKLVVPSDLGDTW